MRGYYLSRGIWGILSLLSVCLSVRGASPLKLLNGFGRNFAQGRRSVETEDAENVLWGDTLVCIFCCLFRCNFCYHFWWIKIFKGVWVRLRYGYFTVTLPKCCMYLSWLSSNIHCKLLMTLSTRLRYLIDTYYFTALDRQCCRQLQLFHRQLQLFHRQLQLFHRLSLSAVVFFCRFCPDIASRLLCRAESYLLNYFDVCICFFCADAVSICVCHVCVINCLLTHSLTYLLAYLLTYLLTDWLTYLLAYLLTYWLTDWLTYWCRVKLTWDSFQTISTVMPFFTTAQLSVYSVCQKTPPFVFLHK